MVLPRLQLIPIFAGSKSRAVATAQLEHPVRQLKTRVEGLVYYPAANQSTFFLLPANGQEGGREYRDSGKEAARIGQLGWRE